MNHDSLFVCKMHSDFRDVHMWKKNGIYGVPLLFPPPYKDNYVIKLNTSTVNADM